MLRWLLLLLLLPTSAPAQDFARATEPRAWEFPRDHGAHPDFGTEWWYFTGAMRDAQGREYGYELTFFRVAMRPDFVSSESPWRARDLMLAHFAVTEVDGERFHLDERLQRAAAGLAGAAEGGLDVWIGDWRVRSEGPDGWRLNASSEDVALSLSLRPVREPVLHGDGGLSWKNTARTEASYYYSIPRIITSGTLRVGDDERLVQGTTWMDQEFFTGETPREGLGWDWFSARLDDGRDLMLYRVRRAGEPDTCFGTLVEADGTSRPLDLSGLRLEPLDTWTSPESGTSYPVAWRVQIPTEQAEFTVRARLDSQEVAARRTVGFAYWEGLSHYEGRWGGKNFSGEGYVELTGYGESTANSR